MIKISRQFFIFLISFSFVSLSAMAQDNKETTSVLDTSTDGTITAIVANRQWYDGPYQFAPAVRAGDFIYFSGTVAGAFGAETPIGADAFKADIRARFVSLGQILEAANASFEDVIKITTFHVFDSPHTTLSKIEQVRAVADVKAEFIKAPFPAWTAVGTTELFPDRGLVEIELIAYAPLEKND